MNKHKLIADIYGVMYILEKEYGKENFEKEFEKLKLEAIVMLADDERERMESVFI